MINYVKRKDLEVAKYNDCIENSIQSRIYAFSWYLDIVADNWDVLVLNDYEAVMPIPWRKKFFIKYAYTPLWVIQLGFYSIEVENGNEFLIELFSKFKFVEMRTNTVNSFSRFKLFQIERQLQVLSLKLPYETILAGFRKDRMRDLSKAKKYGLTEKWECAPKNLIKLHQENVGKRVKDFTEKEYKVLFQLIKLCVFKRKGEMLSIYDKECKLVASGFFLKHKSEIVKLISATDFKNRKNGANTLLIEKALFKYSKQYDFFDFGGSSIKSIANFNFSFGAATENYMLLKYNNLPRLLKFFKK
jgi:hypothetical protein